MPRYRGIVKEVYAYVSEVEAEDGDGAVEELKRVYDNQECRFIADGCSHLRTDFDLVEKLN